MIYKLVTYCQSVLVSWVWDSGIVLFWSPIVPLSCPSHKLTSPCIFIDQGVHNPLVLAIGKPSFSPDTMITLPLYKVISYTLIRTGPRWLVIIGPWNYISFAIYFDVCIIICIEISLVQWVLYNTALWIVESLHWCNEFLLRVHSSPWNRFLKIDRCY